MSLFGELKRRKVFRVAIAYLALAWLVTEVSGTLFPAFGIPDWGVRFVVIVFALGFVPALRHRPSQSTAKLTRSICRLCMWVTSTPRKPWNNQT
jgi:hypothetical protein